MCRVGDTSGKTKIIVRNGREITEIRKIVIKNTEDLLLF